MNKFYTYCLIDPRDCQPFYVGKGTGMRMYDHWKNRNTKRVTNMRLKQRLLEMEMLNIKPVYVVSIDGVTSSEALDKEIELIALYGRLDIGTGCLCNLTDGGEGVSAVGDSSKQKWRQSFMSTPRGKPVSQYTLSGEYVTSFPSAKRASEIVRGANQSYITQCCKGKRVSAGGFMWAYETATTPVYSVADHKRIKQLTLSGEEIRVFLTMTEAANSVNRTPQAISSCCRGKTKKCAGYKWEYME